MTLALHPKTTALVLIDLQAGILGMELAPYGTGQVVAVAAELGRQFAAVGAPIFPVRVGFAADFADVPAGPVDQPMRRPPGGLPPNWSDLDPAIAALPAAATITKRQWGAFHGTELDLQLRRRGITTIVLAGVATNFGVESTAREAWQHQYGVVLAEDGCTSVSAELHSMSVAAIMPRIARVSTAAAIAAALGEPA